MKNNDDEDDEKWKKMVMIIWRLDFFLQIKITTGHRFVERIFNQSIRKNMMIRWINYRSDMKLLNYLSIGRISNQKSNQKNNENSK